jgi:hypothetical protein
VLLSQGSRFEDDSLKAALRHWRPCFVIASATREAKDRRPSSISLLSNISICKPSTADFCVSVHTQRIMFSGSNSYLGGQSGRSGGPQQYGSFQPQQQQQQQPGQQPQSFLNPNPTGYGAAPLQQNYTGFPMQNHPTGFQPQQMQPQQTGFQGNPSPFNNAQTPQQQSFQTGAPPMPQIPQQFQTQTQQQAPQPTAAPVQPQATGFAQMADSFKTPAAAPARGRRAEKPKGTKIPNIRLSFITAQDQAKFEQLFKSAVGDGHTLSGDKSRDLLLRSKLDGNSLSQIW